MYHCAESEDGHKNDLLSSVSKPPSVVNAQTTMGDVTNILPLFSMTFSSSEKKAGNDVGQSRSTVTLKSFSHFYQRFLPQKDVTALKCGRGK